MAHFKSNLLNFIGICLILIMVNLDVTIVNLALPSISRSFDAPLFLLQWVINGYLLSTTMAFVLAGRFADSFGHQKLFFIGMFLFLGGSFVAGISQTIHILILGRVIQGLGVACSFSQAFILGVRGVAQTSHGKKIGLMVTIAGLSQAIGPNLGGFIVNYLGWHWIFLMNVPLVLLSFILVWLFGVSDENTDASLTISLKSIGFFSTGILLMMYAMTQVSLWGMYAHKFYILLGIGIFFLGIFYFREQKIENPLVGSKVFGQKGYLPVVFLRMLYMFGWGFLLFAIPLLLKMETSLSIVMIGFVLFAMTGIFALSAPLAGYLIDLLGPKKPIVLSLWICLVSFLIQILMVYMGQFNLVWFCLSLCLYGISAGLMIAASPAQTLLVIHETKRSTGLSFFYTFGFIGAAAGVGIGGGVWEESLIKISSSEGETQLLAHFLDGSISLTEYFKVAILQAYAFVLVLTCILQGLALRLCVYL